MDNIKEFAEKCKIVTTITIVYKELYGRLIEKKNTQKYHPIVQTWKS